MVGQDKNRAKPKKCLGHFKNYLRENWLSNGQVKRGGKRRKFERNSIFGPSGLTFIRYSWDLCVFSELYGGTVPSGSGGGQVALWQMKWVLRRG